jgi:hypothetical protein
LPSRLPAIGCRRAGDARTRTCRAAAAPELPAGHDPFRHPEEQGIDYAQIEKLMVEGDLRQRSQPRRSPKSEYDGYRWLPVETPLAGMIGKDAITRERAAAPQVRPQDLQRMKPWSVLALLEARGESGSEATMDARLQRMASGAGKRLRT